LIPGCHATTVAYDRITFTDTPPIVEIEPGSEASFDVTLRNAGSQYADVDINTRSITDGISIIDNDGSKLVDMGKSVTYQITIHVSEGIAPGTYQFEIADRSDIDVHTWETIDVRVGGKQGVAEPSRRQAGGSRTDRRFGRSGLRECRAMEFSRSRSHRRSSCSAACVPSWQWQAVDWRCRKVLIIQEVMNAYG